MEKQTSFTDIEYSNRKRKTKREAFLECMDEIIPWDEVIGLIEPYYYKNIRGRKALPIETMFRMYLLQIWYNLADEALEDAIYDSYAMRKFMHLNFLEDTIRLLNDNGMLISDNIFQDGELIESRFAVKRRDRTIHKRMREFLFQITHDPNLITSILTVGDGVAISIKRGCKA